MNTIIQISSREAIPIRAIPYVTGWTMSPDVVAKAFAHTDSWVTKLAEVYAYNLSDDGSYAQALPKEWDGVIAKLLSLESKLKRNEANEIEGYAAWKHDSILQLPHACFVWKDEFEKAFEKAYSEEKLILIDERPGERELNFSPLIPKELQSAVMEGFENSMKDDVMKQVADKPWLVHDEKDPEPVQSWYTPARYFARKLVTEDSTLLNKKSILAQKVSDSLKQVGVYKRSGKKPLAAETILKAFSKITLG